MNKGNLTKIVGANGMVFYVEEKNVAKTVKQLEKAAKTISRRNQEREEKSREYYLRVRARYERSIAKKKQEAESQG